MTPEPKETPPAATLAPSTVGPMLRKAGLDILKALALVFLLALVWYVGAKADGG